jgi:hypothetical protein
MSLVPLFLTSSCSLSIFRKTSAGHGEEAHGGAPGSTANPRDGLSPWVKVLCLVLVISDNA